MTNLGTTIIEGLEEFTEVLDREDISKFRQTTNVTTGLKTDAQREFGKQFSLERDAMLITPLPPEWLPKPFRFTVNPNKPWRPPCPPTSKSEPQS